MYEGVSSCSLTARTRPAPPLPDLSWLCHSKETRLTWGCIRTQACILRLHDSLPVPWQQCTERLLGCCYTLITGVFLSWINVDSKGWESTDSYTCLGGMLDVELPLKGAILSAGLSEECRKKASGPTGTLTAATNTFHHPFWNIRSTNNFPPYQSTSLKKTKMIQSLAWNGVVPCLAIQLSATTLPGSCF